MKKMSVALAALMVMAIGAKADTVTSVNVVGYINLNVYGGVSDTYTLISAPMTKMPLSRGQISANTSNTITDAGASWSTDTFAVGGSAAGETGSSAYYVEITSGLFEGRHFYIASNDATTLTLASGMTDILAAELVDAGYKIIPANRIRDIFGEPGSEALDGGGDSTTADTIRLMQPDGWGSAIYYRNSGFGLPMNSWVQSGVEANDLVVDRDVGLLVLRQQNLPTVELTVVGEVSANAQSVVVVPGFSLVGGMSAVEVAIGDSDLVSVVDGGGSSGDADLIYRWDNVLNTWDAPVYYRNTGFGLPMNAWVQSGLDVSDTYMIEPGVAYLVIRAGSGNNQWDRVSPLQ